MDERELVKRANEYIRKLAKGINPLDNTMVDKDDVVNNIKVSRCLFFVSEILEKYLNGEKLLQERKKPFMAKKEQLADFAYFMEPTTISNIVAEINDIVYADNMKKLTYNNVADWLITKGMLEIVEYAGRQRKSPTELGRKLGISTEVREGLQGNYIVNLYNVGAQKYIIDNIENIVDNIGR